MRRATIGLILAMLPSIALSAEASKASADHEIAAAKSSIDQAAALGDQWTATMTAFKTAKAAEQKGNFSAAEAQAKQARVLAELSIKQATAQKKLWRNEVVH
jgi:hypothetical protein